MYGWKFLAYFTCAFAAEFCFIDYVYGRDEHQKCNYSRVNIELSWDWSSDGDHFLGEHALTFRKGIDDKLLVDHSDSGNRACDHITVYYGTGRSFA